MIAVDYDKTCDVLYLALEEPRPAYSEEMGDGILLRISYETGTPCGVTVFDFAGRWQKRSKALVARVSSLLNAPTKDVLRALQEVGTA